MAETTTELSLGQSLSDGGNPCPLGCSSPSVPVISAPDRLNSMPGIWTVVKCAQCGLRRTNPRPTQDEIGSFYPEDDYGPFEGRERARGWRDWFEFNDRRIPRIPVGRMLEIGCANGSFMQRMTENGWEVEGIEPSPTAVNVARQKGLRVHLGQVESITDIEPVDLVVGWMTLEHLHDPIGALQKMRGWTCPGGKLALSVPNVASIESRVFGPDWYALQLPTHLFHYTPETISKVLAQSGWRMERVLHQRVISNAAISAGWKLSDRHPGRAATWLTGFAENAKWHYALYPVASVLAAAKQTGRMTVWATREN